jgi:hypothetical protein
MIHLPIGVNATEPGGKPVCFLLGIVSVMTRPSRCVVASPGQSLARRVGAHNVVAKVIHVKRMGAVSVFFQYILPTLLGGTGLVAVLVNWKIEQLRERLKYRRELVRTWRCRIGSRAEIPSLKSQRTRAFGHI